MADLTVTGILSGAVTGLSTAVVKLWLDGKAKEAEHKTELEKMQAKLDALQEKLTAEIKANSRSFALAEKLLQKQLGLDSTPPTSPQSKATGT